MTLRRLPRVAETFVRPDTAGNPGRAPSGQHWSAARSVDAGVPATQGDLEVRSDTLHLISTGVWGEGCAHLETGWRPSENFTLDAEMQNAATGFGMFIGIGCTDYANGMFYSFGDNGEVAIWTRKHGTFTRVAVSANGLFGVQFATLRITRTGGTVNVHGVAGSITTTATYVLAAGDDPGGTLVVARIVDPGGKFLNLTQQAP